MTDRDGAGARSAGGPARALWLRAMRNARVRTVAFAYLFAAVAYVQPVTYRHAYPTAASRLGFAASFAHNKAIVLFYGKAYDLLSDGGYSAWRVGGILTIFAAAFGLLAAVAALRGEEDSGRMELVLSGPVARMDAYGAAIAATLAGTLVLWAAELIGLVLGGLPLAGSAYLALATVSTAPVFAGVGALTSEIAPSRRIAIELGAAALAIAFVARVVADTAGGFAWLRWLTPLGWAEELRPFTGTHALALILPIAAGITLPLVAARLHARRDIGIGLLVSHDESDPRTGLLRSATAQALRGERGSLAVWIASVGAFAFIIGVISNSITAAGITPQLQHELDKLGAGSILTPAGYLGFTFLFFVLAVSLFAVSQIAAARQEETGQRLETVLAAPVSRHGWLLGRLGLATAAAAVIALVAALAGFVGAAVAGVSLSLPTMVGAGANCLPVALLFLGIASLLYALVPRFSTGIAYGLLTVAFLWQLFGSLFGAPHWLVDLTPFAHVGLVPAQSFRAGAAIIMLAIALLAVLGAVAAFTRRDLVQA